MFRRHRAIGTIGFIDTGVLERPLERQLFGRLFHCSPSGNRRALHQAAAQAAGRTVGRAHPRPRAECPLHCSWELLCPFQRLRTVGSSWLGACERRAGLTLRRGLKRMSVLKNFCGHIVADGSGRDAYVSAQAHCTHPRCELRAIVTVARA